MREIRGRAKVGYEILNLAPNEMFLDIGCSSGWLDRKLIDTGMKNVYAIDVNKKSIKEAAKNVNGAHFVLGSATNVPFKDEIFDKVSLFDVIEHIYVGGDMTALSEANRVLKKKGTLVVTVPNKGFLNVCQYADLEYWLYNHRHYSEEELISLLRKYGFDIISVCICCRAVPIILVQYIRLFLALLRIFHIETELDVLDRIENGVCKNNQKLKSGYNLMIKARKNAEIKELGRSQVNKVSKND